MSEIEKKKMKRKNEDKSKTITQEYGKRKKIDVYNVMRSILIEFVHQCLM